MAGARELPADWVVEFVNVKNIAHAAELHGVFGSGGRVAGARELPAGAAGQPSLIKREGLGSPHLYL